MALAGLREIDPASWEIDRAAPPLTLRRREDGPSEGYCVESNGVPLGVIGRTYGVDTSRWYWLLSSITLPVDERKGGISSPCGGRHRSEEALAGLAARWRAWLATAGLHPDPA